MPFVESAHSLKARAGLSHIPTPVFAGSIVLALLALTGIGIGFASFADKTSAFSVESAAQQNSLEAALEDTEGSASAEGVQEGEGAQAADPASIYVHVTGAVKAPGVYELPAESRAQDAVDAAGGLSASAAPHAVNLAQKLTDGQQVRIPTKKEVAQVASPVQSSGAAPVGFQDSVGGGGGGLVNINTATEAELDTLPGVGPATAQAIISEREENGPFASPEDVQRVSGIGQKKFQDMKDLICV